MSYYMVARFLRNNLVSRRNEMISEVDIADWDKASQQAYLEWCESYGIDYEPWIGVPDVAAAWKAAVEWHRDRIFKKNEPVVKQVNEYIKKLEDTLKDVKPVSGAMYD